jgi:hypothetical protein
MARLREIPGFAGGHTTAEMEEAIGEFRQLWQKADPIKRALYQQFMHFSLLDGLQLLILSEREADGRPVTSAAEARASTDAVLEKHRQRRAQA